MEYGADLEGFRRFNPLELISWFCTVLLVPPQHAVVQPCRLAWWEIRKKRLHARQWNGSYASMIRLYRDKSPACVHYTFCCFTDMTRITVRQFDALLDNGYNRPSQTIVHATIFISIQIGGMTIYKVTFWASNIFVLYTVKWARIMGI